MKNLNNTNTNTNTNLRKEEEKIMTVEKVVKYYEQNGMICRNIYVDGVNFPVAMATGRTIEECEEDANKFLALLGRFNGNVHKMAEQMRTANDIQETDYPFESALINNVEFLVSVENQEIRNTEGNIVYKSPIKERLSLDSLLELGKRDIEEYLRPYNDNNDDDCDDEDELENWEDEDYDY